MHGKVILQLLQFLESWECKKLGSCSAARRWCGSAMHGVLTAQ